MQGPHPVPPGGQRLTPSDGLMLKGVTVHGATSLRPLPDHPTSQ